MHPKRSKAIHESHGVAATTPILSASSGPATTNTYMRFNTIYSRFLAEHGEGMQTSHLMSITTNTRSTDPTLWVRNQPRADVWVA